MSKNLLRGIIVVVLLFVIGFFLNSFRISQATEAKYLLGKRQEMLRIIDQAAQKKQVYQTNYGTLAQPVAISDLDQVQNMLITKMKASGLDVVSLVKASAPVAPPGANKDKKAVPKAPGAIYEATVSGSWEASMNYLNGLKNDSILLQVLSVRMEAGATGNKVKTTFRYKIFIES